MEYIFKMNKLQFLAQEQLNEARIAVNKFQNNSKGSLISKVKTKKVLFKPHKLSSKSVINAIEQRSRSALSYADRKYSDITEFNSKVRKILKKPNIKLIKPIINNDLTILREKERSESALASEDLRSTIQLPQQKSISPQKVREQFLQTLKDKRLNLPEPDLESDRDKMMIEEDSDSETKILNARDLISLAANREESKDDTNLDNESSLIPKNPSKLQGLNENISKNPVMVKEIMK